jgi:hypothetical protein
MTIMAVAKTTTTTAFGPVVRCRFVYYASC